MAVLSIGQVWGAVSTMTFTTKCNGSGTADDDASWTITSNATEQAFVDGSGIHYGSNNTSSGKVEYIELSTSSISGTISQVVVTARCAQNKAAITVQVGTTSFMYGEETSVTATNTSTPYTFTGSASGNITIRLDRGENIYKALYVLSVAVTYSSGYNNPTLSSVAVSGDPEEDTYAAGDVFDVKGLIVTGGYSDQNTAPITTGITWKARTNESANDAVALANYHLTKDQTSLDVQAIVNNIESEWYTVDELTVTAAPSRLIFTAACGGSGTADDGVEWTVTSDGTESSFDGPSQNNKGIHYGTSGAAVQYIKLSTSDIDGTITKVVVNASTASGVSATVNVTVDGVAFGGDAQAIGTSAAEYTFIGSASGEIEVTITKPESATKAIYCKSIVVTYEETSTTKVATPSISGTENFYPSTTVTITCGTDGATIYYSTDGSAPSNLYSAPFTVDASGTTTVKAKATKTGLDDSDVATKEFTKIVPKTTAAQLVASVTTTEQQVYVKLENWKVNFVSGDYAYIVDTNNEGVVLKQTGHGYVAGNILGNEVVEVAAKKSSGRVQLSGFTSTEISATAGTASPSEVTDYSTITAANQSALVTLKSATYSSSTGTLSDGEHDLCYYDQFSANPTLVDGKNYDVTGIVIYYKTTNQEKIEIAPRTSEDVVPNEEIVIPTAANLAELKAATRGTYILTLTNAVVTYVNGKNVFIEEGTTGALIHLDTHSYEAGNCLNGDYQVTTEDFQGKFEITAIEPQAGAATTTAEIPLTTVTIATLNASFSSYESRRVKIVNANVTDAISGNDRNGAINDGAALAVYAAAGASTITLTANDNVDIIGYPSFYNTNQQFNVWAQADITVNVKEDPELAYDPTVVNLTLDNLAAFTPAQLTYATGFDGVAAITYESSDPSIATVETDGTVTLVATEEGSTTITATFAGNSTYKADNASYTINVGAVPTYSMTFNLDKVSYDDASAAQVVWNSNVATMTIDQNDGTAVNNYLPGGYTSGQTIAPITESRFYTKNSISFAPKSGITITKVEWLATTATYASNLANATWVDADAVVDGTNNKLVIITPSSTGEFSVTLTAQVRATEAIVYYQAESEKARLTASIDIADFDMEIGQDDILLSDVVVTTSNPNKKAISYAVTSGSEYVSITGTNANQAFHALAAGTATITATIPSDLGNYTGATTTFEIEVKAATKLDAELAYDPESVVLTVGGTFNQAELTYATNFDGLADITYESNNENLATVAADGTVTLAEGKTGTATITATFPGNDNYYNDEASYTITINEAADDVTGTWTLVTNAANLAANKKVIVAQYVSEGDDIFTLGKQNGNNRLAIASTVSGSTLSPASGTKVITLVDAGNGLYALKLSNDKYLNASGGTSDNHLKEADDYSELVSAQWSIEITDNKAIITANFSGTNARNLMRYNPNNTNPDIFSCYKSGQNDIALYMLEEDEPEPDPQPVVIRDELTAGKWGTICPKQNVINPTGASFFTLAYGEFSEEMLDKVFFDEIGANESLVAGKPYLFIANGDEIRGIKDGAEATQGENDYNGFHGVLADYELYVAEAYKYYIIYGNEIRLCGTGAEPFVIKAERAYLEVSEIPGYPTQPAPGRRRLVMNVNNGNQMPTEVENVEVSNAPRKVVINGELYIIRGEKRYDVRGQLVK